MAPGSVGHIPVVRILSSGRGPGRYTVLVVVICFFASMSMTAGTAVAVPVYPVAGTIKLYALPNAVAVDPSTHRVYIADGYSEGAVALLVVNDSGGAQGGRQTGVVNLGYSNPPGSVAVDPTTHVVYVGYTPNGYGGGLVAVIDESGDADDGRVTARIAVGREALVAVDPSTHDVYVLGEYPESSQASVTVIDESGDASSGKVTAIIPVGQEPIAIAVDPISHDIYALNGNYGTSTVSVIDESGDARSGTVTATIPVGQQPTGLAVDPTTHTVYVANQLGGSGCSASVANCTTVSVIDESGDARSGTVTATIPIDGVVRAVAVDPTTHDLYVSYETQSEVVAVIDESSDAGHGSVIATVPVGPASDTNDPLAVDSTTHLAYAGIWEYHTLSVIGPLTPPADIAMTVTVPPGASDHSTFTETAVVSNHGPSTAATVDTDLLVPAQLDVVSAPGATQQNGTLVWTDASLASGASLTRTVTFAVDAGVRTTIGIGGVTESANDDPDVTNNSAVAVIRLG